jgi:hypothetical protein
MPGYFPAVVFPRGIPEICAVVGESGKFRGNCGSKEVFKLWDGKFKVKGRCT